MIQNLNNFQLYGTDYNTPDGTCIRDYVHVSDVAEAHINAANYLLEGNKSIIMNLGTNRGHSILEMITALEQITNQKVTYTVNPRRSGDADSLVADTTIAKEVLKYSPKYDIIDILKTAYEWHNGNKD
jgi:UDP-glucose 4-epimerase